MKIIEDLQAPLHIGAGRLPDWLPHKRCLLALDKYADELCIFRCIAVHQGAHRVPTTRKTRELAASFFDKHRVRGRIYKSHFPLIENHFQQGVAGYEIDAEGAFALKYLLSRFDKIRVPQMDIGIYKEHALLITKLDKVTKYYACAECQARFTKKRHLRRHAEVFTRGVSKVACRGDRIQPPGTAYEKPFYGHRAYAGKAVSWTEHEANGGVCISIIKCVAKVGKEELQDIQWMVFVRKQTRCFSSMAAIGMAVQSVFQDGARKWSLSKRQTKAGEG